MATMRDIAREAGVSQSTVSHVINGTRYVSPEVVQAVQEAIERTQYVNDGIARSLKTGRSDSIGLAMSAMSNPYFGSLVHSIEQRVASGGRSIVLTDTHDDPVRERRAISDLLARRPDGILLAASAEPSEAIRLILGRKVPVVFIDRIVTPEVDGLSYDAIGVDNVRPMIDLVALLHDEGHRRIGFVAGQPGLPTTQERLTGYERGLAECGLEMDPRLCASGVHPDGSPDSAAIDALIDSDARPSVLITNNDAVTICTMRRIRSAGLSVPDDIALAVFDDFEWADLFEPQLTAIRQPIDEIGARAVEMIYERISDPDLPPRVERVDATIVVRDSHLLRQSRRQS